MPLDPRHSDVIVWFESDEWGCFLSPIGGTKRKTCEGCSFLLAWFFRGQRYDPSADDQLWICGRTKIPCHPKNTACWYFVNRGL